MSSYKLQIRQYIPRLTQQPEVKVIANTSPLPKLITVYIHVQAKVDYQYTID
jgi:hypothetical protein